MLSSSEAKIILLLASHQMVTLKQVKRGALIDDIWMFFLKNETNEKFIKTSSENKRSLFLFLFYH